MYLPSDHPLCADLLALLSELKNEWHDLNWNDPAEIPEVRRRLVTICVRKQILQLDLNATLKLPGAQTCLRALVKGNFEPIIEAKLKEKLPAGSPPADYSLSWQRVRLTVEGMSFRDEVRYGDPDIAGMKLSALLRGSSWPGVVEFLSMESARPPVEIPPAAEAESADSSNAIQQCWVDAWRSFERAIKSPSGPRPKPLKNVHAWLKDYDPEDYDLPSKETWSDYIRKYKRAKFGGSGNTPRTGRSGRSTVTRNQI